MSTTIEASPAANKRGTWKFSRRKVLTAAVLGAFGLWLVASASVAWVRTRRMGEPFPEPPPKVAWAAVEGQRLQTSDGQEIGGWLVRGDRQKGCVLLLHGIDSSRRGMLPVAHWLAEAKFTVLAISLRGHGDSSGKINDFGWSARHDVVAAAAFLQREFPRQPIYVVGRSMGAAAAIFAAEELKEKISGYVLEQPYKDLESAVWCRLHHHVPQGLDWVAYLGLRLWAPSFCPSGLSKSRRTSTSGTSPKMCRSSSSRGRLTGMPCSMT